jgi:hypothetical protein
MYVETDKAVYYPGETIKGSVHILANKQITEAFQLDILVKGKESFKYVTGQKKERTCRNSF